MKVFVSQYCWVMRKGSKLIDELELDTTGVEIINMRHDREEARRRRYAQLLPIRDSAME